MKLPMIAGARPSGLHVFAPLLAIVVMYRGTWLRHSDCPHDLGHEDWLKLAGPNGCWDDIPGEMDPEHPKPFHLEVPATAAQAVQLPRRPGRRSVPGSGHHGAGLRRTRPALPRRRPQPDLQGHRRAPRGDRARAGGMMQAVRAASRALMGVMDNPLMDRGESDEQTAKLL